MADSSWSDEIAENATELVGKTPMVNLIKIPFECKARIVAKLEYLNPACSVKDRIGVAMIEHAEKYAGIKPGKTTLIEATSGNTGIALAFAAAARGYRLIICMPDTMSIEIRTVLLTYGAVVVVTEGHKGMRGSIEKALLLRAQIPDSYILQQFDNPANVQVHYDTTGPEIWRQTGGQVDAVVFGVGTGGTLTGAGRYLKEMNPNLKIYAVEPEEAAVLSGLPIGPHGIQGLGAGFLPSILDMSLVDEIFRVHTDEANMFARSLTYNQGLLVGISSGANVCAAVRVGCRPEMAGKVIVTVMPSGGERYLSSSLYNNLREEAINLKVETLEECLAKLKPFQFEVIEDDFTTTHM